MTLVVGVGQAGCNLAAEMARVPNARDFLDVFLVNSTLRDLVHIKDVPRTRWLGVNETEGLVPLGSAGSGAEKELTGGMGKNPRRCFTALTERFEGVVNALRSTPGFDFSKERFAVVLFSGGGGTGSGAAPVIARALREVTEGRCRVLGVMVLPAASRGSEEDVGGLLDAWNAWFSMQRSLEVFDGIVLVDNDRLAHVGDIERAFPRFNEYVARCLTDMVLGNLTELVLPKEGDAIVQQSDVMDLVTAMSIGVGGERKPGIASIGRAVQLLQGPLGYVAPVLPYRKPDLVTLVEMARERMSFQEPGVDRCEKAYLLVRAPRSVFNRLGSGQEVAEVLGLVGLASKRGEVVYGTALTKRPLASITLGMTYHPHGHPRLARLERDARRYEKEAGAPAGS